MRHQMHRFPPDRLPNNRFLAALSQLIQDQTAFSAFAKATQDIRLSRKDWKLVLHKELLLLNHWALRRILCCAQEAKQRKGNQSNFPSRVITLLPRSGPVIHVIRRGVPFAATETLTVCGFPVDSQIDTKQVVRSVANALDVSKWLKPLTTSSQAAVKASVKEDLIAVTGKRKSISEVAAIVGSHRCWGSGGRCAVVLGDSRGGVAKLVRQLGAHQVANSCTRIRAGLVFDGKKGSQRLVKGLGNKPWRGPLRTALDRLHPSVIIRIPHHKHERGPERLLGYRVLDADKRGHVMGAHGFAADPVYGWPGDYSF